MKKYLLAGMLGASMLRAQTLDDFQDFLGSTSAANVEEFLAKLHAFAPGWFANYTLIPRSASLQHSTPQQPRVIVFDEKARVVLTFNGASEQVGGEHIEVLQALSGQEIQFTDIEFSEGRLRRHDNPEECGTCHAKHRPIWTEYPQWPSAFGATDDVIGAGTEDETDLTRFNQRRSTHPRYKFLRPRNHEDPIAPYTRVMFDPQIDRRPNLRLTKLLAGWYAESLARKLQQRWRMLSIADQQLSASILRGDIQRYTESYRSARDWLRQRRGGVALNYGFVRRDPLIYEWFETFGSDRFSWSLDPDAASGAEFFEGKRFLLDLVIEKLIAAQG